MIVGVVHLRPMPGDAAYRSSGFEGVLNSAWRDFEALVEGGVDAVIVENFGSAPFVKGISGHRLPPHQAACIARLVAGFTERWPEGALGVNCLRNDALSALGIAAACGASFVRVNVHVGAYVTDQGVIEGEAAKTLRYRRELGDPAEIAIWADVLVKHAAPLAPLEAAQATHDCVLRGLADAVIVTGRATGAPVDVELLKEVSAAAHQAPVYLGSGVTPARLGELAAHADGAIVGTWLKRDGELHAPVDAARVRQLVEAARGAWRA